MEKPNVLSVRRISKRFGGLQALDRVRLDVRAGEVHALIGANGAGKSTLIKIITGAVAMDKDGGDIVIGDEKVEIKNPNHARQLGISAVYQEFSLINTLTVAENIFLGVPPTKVKHLAVDWREMDAAAKRVLAQLDTPIDTRRLVRDLSVAQRQVVEIAKALANNSRVLILDEPSASLTDNDIEQMFKVIRTLKAKGIGIVYVSHRLEELPHIADRVTIFRDGKYVVTLPMAEAPKQTIIEHMVGHRIEVRERPVRPHGEEVLRVEGLTGRRGFRDVSFSLHRGEILGLAGLAGAGRTEVARAIFGVDAKVSGSVCVHGRRVDIRSPRDAKRQAIGFITEDRKEEGLILAHSIQTNIAMGIFRRMGSALYYAAGKERGLAEEYVTRLSIKTDKPANPAGSLSGGNQQKVVIAKWLATLPEILIMDEPTRGIDVGSKEQIYDLLFKLSNAGKAVLLISSEIPEILDLSDRILVMANGRITGEFGRGQVDQETILHYATMAGPAA
jgi:ribose transport system ATP-binding protein